MVNKGFELIPIWKRIEGRKEKRKICSWGTSLSKKPAKSIINIHRSKDSGIQSSSSLKSHTPMLIASWRWWRIPVNNELRSIIHSTLSIVLVISGQKWWFLAVFFVLFGTKITEWPLNRSTRGFLVARLLLVHFTALEYVRSKVLITINGIDNYRLFFFVPVYFHVSRQHT